MGQRCTVCTHTAADAIDAALEAGQPLRAFVAEYGLSRSALDRHRRFHLWEEGEADEEVEESGDNARATSSTLAHPGTSGKPPIAKWGLIVGAFVVGFLLGRFGDMGVPTP